jgi:transposase
VLKRAQVLSLLDRGKSPSNISEYLEVGRMTVYRVKDKFKEKGLGGALEEPSRPSKHRVLDERRTVEILAMACETPPAGRSRWTVQLVTSEAMRRGIVPTITKEPIRKLLHEGGLKPWREKNVVHQGGDGILRDQDGGRPGSVPTPPESQGTGGMPG